MQSFTQPELTSNQTNKLAFGQSHAFKKSLMSSEMEKKKKKTKKRVGHHRKTLFKKLFGKFSRHGKYIILFVNKQNKLLKFPSAENIIFHNSFSICHSCSVKPHSVWSCALLSSILLRVWTGKKCSVLSTFFFSLMIDRKEKSVSYQESLKCVFNPWDYRQCCSCLGLLYTTDPCAYSSSRAAAGDDADEDDDDDDNAVVSHTIIL